MSGFRLERTDDHAAAIDALASSSGGRVALADLLGDLDRQGRRARVLARAVHRAWTFTDADRRDPRWWPQGVSTSADASETGRVEGREVAVVAWYAKKLEGDASGHGSRVTLMDVESLRYRHVLLVVPTLKGGVAGFEPLRVHAGGIVWCGPYLHVAATAKGFFTCRLDDLLRLPEPAYGHDYVLPVRFAYRAGTDEGQERLRYSFLSLDRASTPPGLVAGEYARGAGATRRLARFPLDPETLLLATGADGASRPVELADGVAQMQGAVVARGRWHLTVSRGSFLPGTVVTGRPGAWRRHRLATPIGPEDVSYWPQRDELWSVTEHPRRRWVYAMRRSWFD